MENDDRFKDVPPELVAAIDAVFAYGPLKRKRKTKRRRKKALTIPPVVPSMRRQAIPSTQGETMNASTKTAKIAKIVESIEAMPISEIVEGLRKHGIRRVPMTDGDGRPYLNLGDTNIQVFKAFGLLGGYRTKSARNDGRVLRELLDERKGRMGYEVKQYDTMLYPKYLYRIYGDIEREADPGKPADAPTPDIGLIADIIEEEVNDGGYRVGQRLNWQTFSERVAVRGRNRFSLFGEPFLPGVLGGMDRKKGRTNAWTKAADTVPHISRKDGIVQIESLPEKGESVAITRRSIARFADRLNNVGNGVIRKIYAKNGRNKRDLDGDILLGSSNRALLESFAMLADATGCAVSIGTNSREAPVMFRHAIAGIDGSRFRVETIHDEFLKKDKYRYFIGKGGDEGEWPIPAPAIEPAEEEDPADIDAANKDFVESRMARMLAERSTLVAEAKALREQAEAKEREAERLEREARGLFDGMLAG